MKKKLFKILLSALLALLCAGVISACGDTVGTPDGSGTPGGSVAQECKHNYTVKLVEQKPTCGDGGYECTMCQSCGARYDYEYLQPTGKHTYDEGKVVTEADCTHDRAVLYTCTDCGQTKTEVSKIFGGHDYSDPVVGANPTCTSEGYTYTECSRCGDRQYTTIDKLGHDYLESVTVVEPTCTGTGYSYEECSRCGDRQCTTLDSIGHDWDEGRMAFSPDCTHNGLKVITCTNCDETKSEILYATGEHDYINNVCKYCRLDLTEVIDKLYNGSYGYEYFRTLDKAAGFCGLYDAIDESAKAFHHSETMNATQTDDGYEFLTVNYAAFGLSDKEAISVWKTYFDDKPLYYWINKTLTVYGDNIILYADDKYATATARSAYNANLYEKLTAYKDIAAGESAYSVALAYHDKIVKDIDYAYKDNGYPEDAAWAHSITGVFDGVGAVCEGYARSFQLLLNMRGIKNILVTGKGGGGNHAWNLVRLDDGQWYWYDLTFDDTPHKYWGVSHTYAFATDDSFLSSHTVGSSIDLGIDFMPVLPERAEQAYAGDELLWRDEFTVDGFTYTIDGYDSVYLSYIGKFGERVDIPETVTYGGREFTVVCLLRFNGNITTGILPNKNHTDGGIVGSLKIPASVVYIDDYALCGSFYCGLENFIVDEDNPVFRSLEGVLFTKNLYTLVSYPLGNSRTSYAIPDETVEIARKAINGGNINSALETLCIGKNLKYVGCITWGSRYPEIGVVCLNYLAGAWPEIVRSLNGKKELIISDENPRFSVRDGLLCNYDERYGTSVEAVLPTAEHVVFSNDVYAVEHDAFYYHSGIKSVEFTTATPLIRWSIEFTGCGNLESVTLPEGLKTVNARMFSGCTSLAEVNIPSTVTKIEKDAFSYCLSLTSITIPASVTSIAEDAFRKCDLLKEIIVEQGNTAYRVEGSCLIEIATDKVIIDFGKSENR